MDDTSADGGIDKGEAIVLIISAFQQATEMGLTEFLKLLWNWVPVGIENHS